MNDLDPKTRPAYLRRITIRDRAADTGEDAPVHVGDFVLLDDEEHKGLVWLAEGWTAEGSSVDGSIVSFYVDASRATIGRVIDAATGKFDPFCLDGIPVLVPRDCEWEIVERVAHPYTLDVPRHVAKAVYEALGKLFAPKDPTPLASDRAYSDAREDITRQHALIDKLVDAATRPPVVIDGTAIETHQLGRP
jgi:hypothetical protein